MTVLKSARPSPWVSVSTIRSPRKKTFWIWRKSATAMRTTTAATRTAYCTHRMRWARLRGESLRTRPAAAGDVMAMTSRHARHHGRLGAEPLLVAGLVRPVLDRLLEGRVEGVLDLGGVCVVLLEEEAVLLAGVELLDHGEVRVGLGEVEQGAVVVDGRVDPTGLHAGDLGRQVVEDDGLVAVGVLVLVGIGLAGRVGLDTELLALERRQVRDVGGLLRQEGLRRAEVGRRERHRLLPLVVDGDRAHGHVALLRGEHGTGGLRGEVDVDDGDLGLPQLLRGVLREVHVEADDVARAVLELERLVRQVRAHREGVRADELRPTGGVASTSAAARVRAAGGEGEGREGDDGRVAEKGRPELRHLHSSRIDGWWRDYRASATPWDRRAADPPPGPEILEASREARRGCVRGVRSAGERE